MTTLTTPFVKRMRTQGGTIYTFSSALEDIGLNINERNNTVKMSHYALLNIPSIGVNDSNNFQQNRFNVFAIPGAYESFLNSGSVKDSRVIIAESFQNYALNLETNLLSSASYNPSLLTTVSERVFWKWLKETGAIRWDPINTSNGMYWHEEIDVNASIGYNSVVKCIGEISAGSVRTNSFGTYNETYVLVPTSFGQTPVYFKQIEDDNYYHGLSIASGYTNILGRENYLKPHPDALDIQAYYDLADTSTYIDGPSNLTMSYDNSTGSYTTGWWWTQEGFPIINTDHNRYFVDTSAYMTDHIYNITLNYNDSIKFYRSKVDCLSIEFDNSNLSKIYNNDLSLKTSLDALAIKYAEDNNFDFNAVLIYYSVYNKAGDILLGTNLLGVLFLDSPSGNTSQFTVSDIQIPSITKLQSGPSGFGTAYSFRLNVKSDYMLDDTGATINDESTSAQTALSNWTEVFNSLGQSLGILNQQTGTLAFITEQYLDITANQTNLINQINNLESRVNNVNVNIQGVDNAITMFSSGSDPLVDSSIYMKRGNVGFFNNDPTYPIQMDLALKTKEIIIDSSDSISAIITTGTTPGQNIKIAAGDHNNGHADGGNLILKAGDTSQGNGGDIEVFGGAGSSGLYATRGQIYMGRNKSNLKATTNEFYLGDIPPLESAHLLFFNSSTGRVSYGNDTSTGSYLTVEASMNEILNDQAIMNSSIGTMNSSMNEILNDQYRMNASIGAIDSSIMALDMVKAGLNNPSFTGQINVAGWVFNVDSCNNLSFTYGSTVVMQMTTDGSIITRGAAMIDNSLGV